LRSWSISFSTCTMTQNQRKATHTLRTLKQMRKPFARHLTTFKQTLLKAEDLKWDDAVKKTFLSNSLDITLMQALIVTSISVLYDEYIILLQWVSHNLNSIQGCYSRVLYNNYHHHATVSQNNMNWELIEHIIVTVTETEESAEHNECQRRKWWNVIWNNYACTAKTMTTSLRTANFCLLYDLASSMLLLLRL
jgi:hypothetical protein